MNRPSPDPGLDPLALDDRTVERLLAGDLPPDQVPPGYAEVAAVLAATVAAPTPEELSGQAAMVAELRAVHRAHRAQTARRAGRPAGRRRVGLAVVVVLGALSIAGAAGAATGQLPGPVREAVLDLLTRVGVTPSAPATDPGRQPVRGPENADRGDPTAGGRGARTADAADPRPGPTPAAPHVGAAKDGLCQAFLAGQGAERGRKADAAAFKALAEAAGGADQIASFCQATRPGSAEPKGKDHQPPRSPPGNQGQGQGGPPPTPGGGNQGKGGPQPSPSGR